MLDQVLNIVAHKKKIKNICMFWPSIASSCKPIVKMSVCHESNHRFIDKEKCYHLSKKFPKCTNVDYINLKSSLALTANDFKSVHMILFHFQNSEAMLCSNEKVGKFRIGSLPRATRLVRTLKHSLPKQRPN